MRRSILLAVSMAYLLVAVGPAMASKGGVPANESDEGRTFGAAVSDAANSGPGAVGDAANDGDGPAGVEPPGADFAAAMSARPAQVPGNPMYLALGDSWAAGQGATDEAADGYVGQLFEALRVHFDCLPARSANAADGCRHLQLLNLGRKAGGGLPGVTAFHVLTEQLPVAIPLLEERNGDENPRNDVEVITLHVGGNDVAGPIQDACLGGFVFDPCVITWITEMGTFEAELRAIVEALREAAGPDTPIVLGTYDNPVPACDLSLPPPDGFGALAILLGAFLLDGVPDAVVPGGLDGVHTVIARVAGDYGASVADVYTAFDVPADFVGGADCLHPTDTGHDKVTDAFLALLAS